MDARTHCIKRSVSEKPYQSDLILFIMKKIIIFWFVLLTLFGTTSCATLFGKNLHPLAVSSDPRGAIVFVNGFNMGQTPIELNLKADKSYTIEYRKEGYQSVTRVVNTKVGAG